MTRQTYRTGNVTTPSSLKASGALSGSQVPHAAHRHGIAPHLGCLCIAALLSTASVPALAQSALLGADSGVFVNEALLDGINQQGVPVLPYGAQGGYQANPYQAQPGYGAGGYNPGAYGAGGSGTVIIGGSGDATVQGGQQYVTRPSTLLFPPPNFPRSRVTIIDSGTATAGGNATAGNRAAARGNLAGTATQPTSSLVPPATSSGASGAKAESRLLVPLPPSISPQAPAAQTAASKPAKPKVTTAVKAPPPPKNVAQAKSPEPPKKAAPAPAAPVKQAAVATPAPPVKTAPPAPKVAAAPPPPKIVPKAAPVTAAPTEAAPKTASVAKAQQLTDTTAALTPPPPPPVAPSGSVQAEAPAPTAPKAQPNDAAPATASNQTASRGNTAVQVSEVQVLFNSSEAGLSGPAKTSLESVAQAMLEDDSSIVQLFAYAGQADIDATQARRLSLSRAMAVRAFLIGKGVRPARMQVRALGNKTTSGSPDRVDVVPAKR